jgi:hypothetical protein
MAFSSLASVKTKSETPPNWPLGRADPQEIRAAVEFAAMKVRADAATRMMERRRCASVSRSKGSPAAFCERSYQELTGNVRGSRGQLADEKASGFA